MVAAIRSAPPELTPIETMRLALVGSFGHIVPEEAEQVLQRARLSFSVPALRMRSLDSMLSAIDVLAAPLAERLGRPADDFRVQAFVGACVGAIVNAVTTWVTTSGDVDILPMSTRPSPSSPTAPTASPVIEGGSRLPARPGLSLDQEAGRRCG